MFKPFTVTSRGADVVAQPTRNQGVLETQAVMGEVVLGVEMAGGFVFVEAVEQPKFYPAALEWRGYPGCIDRHCLVEGGYLPNLLVNDFQCKFPFGTKLYSPNAEDERVEVRLPGGGVDFIGRDKVIPCVRKNELSDEGRSRIVAWGKKFLGAPYLWGGRNGASCDCSGLVNLLYAQEGIQLPRDAHDQFLLAKPIGYEGLKAGDFIFLSSGGRVHHVMLFLEGDLFLEAAGGQIREVVLGSGERKLGRPLNKIKCGEKVGSMRVFFATFLDKNKVFI